MARLRILTVLIACLLSAPLARADAGRFDLAGPKVDVRVTRAGKTLPIASVPNLQSGDRIWVHPDLPPTQSVRYLLVMVFLRGTTNPPPDEWFTRIETWNKKVREEGVEVIVPAEAQQAMAFLAPVTGGDFTTRRSAFRGRPGVFVRASQDLNEAGFEQARIEKYLAAIRMAPPGDAKALLDHSNLLASTLALRPNPDCFKRDVDQQVTCLTQTGTQTLLDDGHGQTVVASLTTGASSDLISAASYTQMAGGGVYSAYVGAVVDLARLLGGLHTAQYQYIPAIALPKQEEMNLRLNTPPSFHNPKSVIVLALPAIQKSIAPPLRSTDAQHVTCLLRPNVAIPLDGAPLVFSTMLAHDLVLHLSGEAGAAQDLPLKADAYQGGLVLEQTPRRHPLVDPGASGSADKTAKAEPLATAGARTGTIRGFWGFDAFEGPTVPIQDAPGEGWKVLSGEPLIAGREDHLVLTSTGNACLESITFDSAGGASLKVASKPVAGAGAQKEVSLDLPLASATPGSLRLAVHQYGAADPISLAVRTYSDASKVEAMRFHAGDRVARVSGQQLDQIREVTLNDVHLLPAGPDGPGALNVAVATGAETPAFHAGDKITAQVKLADDRVVSLPVTVEAARPSVTLRSVLAQRDDNSPIKLVNKNDLRVDSPVTMILKAPGSIPRSEEIELATMDADPAASLSTKLGFSSGALVLQDAKTLRVTFDPMKVFGASIFGPVRMRVVDPHSDPGDWIPLGTFVRLPSVTGLACPADASKPCMLSGSGLFLIDSVGSDAGLTAPMSVPEDFADAALPVPHPASGLLYLHLRDDKAAVATLTLPVQAEPAHLASGPRVAPPAVPH